MNIKYGLLVLLIALSLISTKSYSYNIAQNICEYIAADDKKRLRKLLKSNHLKLRKLYSDISCNNKNMLIFAASKKAKSVGELLVKKLPKKILQENASGVETEFPELGGLLAERVN